MAQTKNRFAPSERRQWHPPGHRSVKHTVAHGCCCLHVSLVLPRFASIGQGRRVEICAKCMLVLLAIFSECASPHLSLSAREETTQQGSDGEKTAASADNKRNKQAVLDWFQKYD